MVSAQTYLNVFYHSKGQRSKIKELNIRNEKLTGSLDLSDFSNLEELDCSNNNLTTLILPQKKQLQKIDCESNNLTNLNFLTTLTSESLTHLSVASNKLTDNLVEWEAMLSKFINLEQLYLTNNSLTGNLEVFAKLINLQLLSLDKTNISGSLQPLQSLTKLRGLAIRNTNITNGLEYLPASLERIYCDGELAKQLKDYKDYDEGNVYYNYQVWKKDHPQLIQPVKQTPQTLPNLESIEQSLQHLKIVKKREKGNKQTLPKAIPTSLLSFISQNSTKPTFERLIGKGGYGEVYYGKWNLQDVAVKKLYLSLDNISAADTKIIEKEIKIIQNLRNRYIIQYYGIYSDNKEIFIIMDYAEQGTLTKFINDRAHQPHDWKLNTKLIKQIVLGLAYIHHGGVIHRDLKSLNILLTDNNDVKISDFGLSKTKITSSTHSKHNAPAGTVRWMAPEILKEQKYSEQSDIYSLGMVIWEITSQCTTPFKDLEQTLVMFKIYNHEKETIPTNTPAKIKEIIEGCWKDNPQQRISLERILELQTRIEIPPK